MSDSKPVVATAWFDRHQRITRYARYAAVWERTAQRVFGRSADIIKRDLQPPDFKQPCQVFHRGNRKIGPSKTLSWLQKIREWADIVELTPTGRPLLMTDIDVMFFSNPFDDLPSGFDVGICGNNTGAVYFSGSLRSHTFMAHWLMATEMMIENVALYQDYDRRYKGLDQASMGYLLEMGGPGANVVQLPRRFHSTCEDYEMPCHVMHYHSKLRAVVFGDRPASIVPEEIRPYAAAWRLEDSR